MEAYKFKDLPLPWAEFKAIKEMMASIQSSGQDIATAFLMRPKTAEEVTRTLQTILPKDYTAPILIQMQSYYDADFLNQVRQTLDTQGYGDVRLIQTVGMDDPEAQEKVMQINTDTNVDFVLFDSSQRGGTGEPRTREELLAIMRLAEKQMFLAGGLRPETIGPLLSELQSNGIQPVGVDVESSLEYPKTEQTIGPYRKESGPIVILRKDPNRVGEFVTNANEAFAA